MNDYTFGNFVCMLREKQGFTQAELASMLGITAAAVSKWENGESKPRVEMLFKLAKILEVSPEELIAGKYLPNEALDRQAVEQINARYEYLCAVDSHVMLGTKIRRCVACIIDWNISCVLAIIPFIFLVSLLRSTNNPWIVLPAFICMLLFPALFVLRDFIWKKQSIGKRIMGLIVLDKRTADVASRRQCLIRNLFLPIYAVDGIIMLVNGMSVGDYVAHTVVVSKKYMQSAQEATAIDSINAYKVPVGSTGRSQRKIVVIIILCVLLLFALIFGIVSCTLNYVTESEQYAVAYNYLIHSEAFAKLGVSADEVKLNGYSYQLNSSQTKEAYVARFTFSVEAYTMEIICHKDLDSWYVCEECTSFT